MLKNKIKKSKPGISAQVVRSLRRRLVLPNNWVTLVQRVEK